jgi:hypothetical protein
LGDQRENEPRNGLRLNERPRAFVAVVNGDQGEWRNLPASTANVQRDAEVLLGWVGDLQSSLVEGISDEVCNRRMKPIGALKENARTR